MDAYLLLAKEAGNTNIILMDLEANTKLASLPATKANCRKVGRMMIRQDCFECSHSSSFDFPKEHGLRFNPHEFVQAGMEDEYHNS